MTEEEAKTKWCPFARSPSEDATDATAVNRGLRGAPDVGCYCIGSACMAWRWSVSDNNYDPRFDPPRPGYCGLAGRP